MSTAPATRVGQESDRGTLLLRVPPLLLATMVLHIAVMPQLRVAGVAADLLLLLGIAAGLVAGPDRGAIVGFASGLLADCFLQTPFGLSALAGATAAYAAGSFSVAVLQPARWMQVAVAAIASAAGVAIFATVGGLLGHGHLVSGRMLVVIGVVALLNGVLALPAMRAVRWAVPPGPAMS